MVSLGFKTDQSDLKPVEIRGIFGANLRQLSSQYPSIAGLCRELGINRTQYNRYLSGESFPRPDVLHRICQFFGTDARILLEPVNEVKPANQDLLSHPIIAEYLGRAATLVDEQMFPSGFYRFTRVSFIDSEKAVLGLVHVSREDGFTFLRGFEAREAMRQQGLPDDPQTREFRGLLMAQEQGVAALVSRRGSVTCSFNFLARVAAFDNNFWEGYTTRTIREAASGPRAARVVYEHLGRNTAQVFASARQAGLIDADQIPAFHRRLLRLNEPFR
ncbi:helix-turn-helix domain-containing protein [Pseudooceanicola marinus]|uniref:helix-turn-helix domain-containing protein n=1 Tax=Pseudooceanicola marinus TaxID=396013 RepID=UPI001C966525|nr:helix-turn-helix transcriptional regulator [Pseudooceanicola marinus]MBY5973605.1 helix-turn-helix domain-containing protein [Ferrimonas balearica]MCA1334119.1 helix-turn-helix domain-containing protein [Pseudooceanicola marinus]